MALAFHLMTPRDSGLQRRLGDALARHLAAADLLGRLQILRHVRKGTGKLLPLSAGAKAVRFDEGDPDALLAGFAFGAEDPDSEKFIRNLTPVSRQIFDGLTAQYQKSAFTLAGVSDVRLIAKIQEKLAEIAKNGGTVEDFHAAVRQLTGDADVAELNSFTLDTAFNTAMQKAYSAGRLEQMRQPHVVDAMPFWQYWTVGDLRVRPEHRVLDGFLARAIDPVWMKIYPPSGYNCRCSVVPIDEEEALKADPNASEGGLERLPLLAQALVPTPGFHSLIRP